MTYEALENKIIELFEKKKEINLAEILENFPKLPKSAITGILKKLLNENIISKSPNLKHTFQLNKEIKLEITELIIPEEDKRFPKEYAEVLSHFQDYLIENINKLPILNGEKTFLYISTGLSILEDCFQEWKKLGLLKEIEILKNMIMDLMLQYNV